MTQHRNFVDDYGFMLETSRSWGTGDGRGDSVGRTVRAGIIYREPKFFHAIWEHFGDFILAHNWDPRRHPEIAEEGFSRDHTVWLVVWLKYFYESWIHIALYIPKQIAPNVKMTIDIKWWIRSIARGRWTDKIMYWIIGGTYMRFVAWWNNKIYHTYGVYSVDYKDFRAYGNQGIWGDFTPEDVKVIRDLVFPSYSFDIQAFMVKCLDDGWIKNRLKKRVIALVEPTNWMIRKLMDDTFNLEDIKAINEYTGLDGWRWGRRMDVTTGVDRFPLEGPQPEYNMDVDVLHCNLNHK